MYPSHCRGIRSYPSSTPSNTSTSPQRTTPTFMTTTTNDSTLTEDHLRALLGVAIAASKKAGEIILGNAGGAEVTERKANSRDLLTLVDPLCEKTIRETILSSYPSHDFLGEEDVPPGAEASAAAIREKLTNNYSGFLWIVDPIDGTSNFVHGIPLCMPSIALAHNGEIILGVIHDPHRDETFTAIRGHGAYMNNNPIKVGTQSSLGDAIVAMGSPPAETSMNMSLLALPHLMPKVRTIRMLGSAALMLAWVACGRLTAYWEYDLSSWDVAAGSILIEEAGGEMSNLDGRRWDVTERKICGSNGSIHQVLLEALKEAGVA
ncbi:hypothetical protein HJC23_011187 [Cyclotella cryptica]|uniref:Inositol-1-monophosphatase n=1 Tax=Cyclotella cryptica TaxID=29204 RepID=A0ABD3PCG0_9STRA